MLRFVCTGFALLLMAAVLAQTARTARTAQMARKDLEKERTSLQNEIEAVKRSLKKTHRDRKAGLDQLALLQRKLALRESSIRNTNTQIRYIQNDMESSGQEIRQLRQELDTLQARYAAGVVLTYKNRSTADVLYLIFSSTDLYDAMKRVQYLRAFHAYERERQEQIRRMEDTLQGKMEGLKQTQLEKDRALQRQNEERATLVTEKKETNVFVERLRSREKDLQKEMKDRQRKEQRLAAEIARAIRRAQEAEKAAARKNEASGTVREAEAAEEKKAGAANFERKKGSLPWPVDSRTIAIAFGPYKYMPGVIGNNHGITIAADEGAAVRAVADGKVQEVFADLDAVMICHGRYFTTYLNLSGISVDRGEDIKAGQTIGRVGAGGKLDFWLSDEKNTMYDPENWLRK